MKTIKVKYIYEIPNDFTGIAEYYDGYKTWYLNGKLHRENSPAIERPSGEKFWYYCGKLCIDFEEVKRKHYRRICNPNS